MSLLERAAALVPAEVDLALEAEIGDALLWTGRADDALRRADALAERALLQAIVSTSSAGASRRASSGSTWGLRARRRCWRHSSSRRCPCSRPPTTTWLCTSPTTRSRRWRRRAGGWTQGSGLQQAFAHARRAGHLPPGYLGRAPHFGPSGRLPYRNCSRRSTRTSHPRGEITSSMPIEPRPWRC